MDSLYDFGSEFSQVYTETCECGKVHEVSAQEDFHPEFYADVFIKCDCGKSVGFELPVN